MQYTLQISSQYSPRWRKSILFLSYFVSVWILWSILLFQPGLLLHSKHPSEISALSARQEKIGGWLLYIRLFFVASPMNITIMNTMIGGGLPGSSEFVISSISVCIVGREEAPIISQTHAYCWVVKMHQIPHADMTNLAPNRRRYIPECRCKRNWRCSHHRRRSHRHRGGHRRRKNRRQSLHARDGKGL